MYFINSIFVFLFISSAQKVHSCIYNGKTYSSEGDFIISHDSYWFCWASYVYNENQNMTILTFENIDINCETSSFIINDADSLIDYCESKFTGSRFIYLSYSKWISLNMKGNLDANMTIQFFNQSDIFNQTTIVPGSTTSIITQILSSTTTSGASIEYNTTTSNVSTEYATTTGPLLSTTPILTTSQTFILEPECGIPKIKPNENNLKVVGGQTAIPKSWPWQVALIDYGLLCGGILINNQWILTAAHCDFYLNTLFVKLGEYDRSNVTDNILNVKAETIIKHPSYGNPLGDAEYDYDIALVKMKTPIVFIDEISPICMPNGRKPEIGSRGITTGWGKTSSNDTGSSPMLRQTTITIMENEVCETPKNLLTSRMICAGELNPVHSSCYGDSGGPFVLKDETSQFYYLAGLVSSGNDGCGGRTVYTKVVEFESWIKETIENN